MVLQVRAASPLPQNGIQISENSACAISVQLQLRARRCDGPLLSKPHADHGVDDGANLTKRPRSCKYQNLC